MREKVISLVNEFSEEFKKINSDIYKNPEIGHQEFDACHLLCDTLERNGFKVERGFCSIPTAFRATYSATKAGAVIGYMAEYDALPEVGHGCGHNMIATISVGAGIVLSKLVDQIGGTVIVLGTPAEETSGAKVTFAEEGIFENWDVALITHPAEACYKSGTSLAMDALKFSFVGHPAHAAASPDSGINALDAVINTFNNINALRQQTRPDVRIHGVISRGGEAPNVIPSQTEAKFYVRSASRAYLDELSERVKNCARGASLAAGTQLSIENYEYSYSNMITNQNLSQLFAEVAEQITGIQWKDPRQSFGSLDTGNVSHCCPAIHPYFGICSAPNLIAHTKEFADATVSDYAVAMMLKMIAVMTSVGVEILQNPPKLQAIQEEFRNSTK